MQAPTPLPEVAQKALDKLQALCPMRFQNFVIMDQTFTIWTPCDIDFLLNALIEKEDKHLDVQDERMPYWAELWPSSLLMAQTILEKRSEIPSGRWLEVGCGPGLPGIVAARIGHKGTFSDYMQEALWLATLNAHQNNCEKNVRFEEIDWRNPTGKQSYSWILAGDLVYERRNFIPLLSTFDSYLEPGGEIWVAEPGRSIAKSFFDHMESEGWIQEVISQNEDATITKFIKRTR